MATDQPIHDMTDTWSQGGTTFHAIKMNVTDAASAADSSLITMEVSGEWRFILAKDGSLRLAKDLDVAGGLKLGRDLEIAHGGTGASTADAARNSLGVTAAIESAYAAAVTTVRGDVPADLDTLAELLAWSQVQLSNKQSFSRTPIANADTIRLTGKYLTSATFTGSPFAGTDGNNQGYLEHVQWTGDTYAMQVHTQINGPGLVRVRIMDNGVWRSWRVVLHLDHEIATRAAGSSNGFIANTNFVAIAVANGLTAVRGGIETARDTLLKLADWTTARLAEKLNLTGGRMTGPLRLAPASLVQVEDSGDGRYSWTLNSADLLFGFYWNAEQGLGSPGYKLSVDREGRISTAELGDLRTYLNQLEQRVSNDSTAKAVARVAKAGDIMTGALDLRFADPFVRLANPGVRAWFMQTIGANFRLVDETGSYEHTVFLSSGDLVFSRLPGQNGVALSTVAARASRGDEARTIVDTKFEAIRLNGSFASGTSQNYDTPSGGVVTGYIRDAGNSGAVSQLKGKYIQGFSPSRGWVQAYNE